MNILKRILLAYKFIMLPKHKEEEFLEIKTSMHNHYSKDKKKICIRCKKREALWWTGKCNRCSDIGYLE